MRLGALIAIITVTTGCATGSPMGGWLAAEPLRYRSASPPAFPRAPLSENVTSVAEARRARQAQEARRAQAARKPSAAPAASPRKDTGAVAQAPKPTPLEVVAAPRASSASEPARPTASAKKPSARPASSSGDAREVVLTTARSLVGQSQVVVGGRKYPSDCTGLIEATYAQAGVSFRGTLKPGDNGVTALYRYARAHGRVYTEGRPVPGDLVFFRETYDQNRDGRRNDGLTHVGLVDAVGADGTVTVIHRVKRGVVRYRMNLARPQLPRDPKTGEVLNDMLRSPAPGHPHVLTGQLFAAFGSVLPGAAKPVAVAAR